jgi:Heavy-metal resistance
MKRQHILLNILAMLLVGAMAQAQSPAPSPSDSPQDTLRALVQGLQARGQQGGVGRGAVGTPPRVVVVTPLNGAWWTNTNLVARLGLTDDQKTKIEKTFENHRQALTSNKDQLEKEETQLAKLLGAETIDRNAVLSQIDRVVQARGEMERTNSVMTMEMREYLTLAQWTQLQSQPIWLERPVYFPAVPGIRGGGQRGNRGQQ